MKKIILIIVAALCATSVYAQSSVYTLAQELQKQGKYVAAKQYYQLSLKMDAGTISVDIINLGIKQCNDKIDASRKAYAAKMAEQQKAEIKKNGFVYVSSSAYDLNGREVMAFPELILGKTEGVHYTQAKTKALYQCDVAVATRIYNAENHIAEALAVISIENAITGELYATALTARGGHTTNNNEAAKIAIEKLSTLIARYISGEIGGITYPEETDEYASKIIVAIYPYGTASDEQKTTVATALKMFIQQCASDDYVIKETDAAIIGQINAEANVQYNGTVNMNYLYEIGNDLGAQRIVAVRVDKPSEEGGIYKFSADLVSMAKHAYVTATYPNPMAFDDIDNQGDIDVMEGKDGQDEFYYAAAKLMYRLGLGEAAKLGTRINQLREKIQKARETQKNQENKDRNKRKLDNALRAFVPGCAQIYKYSPGKGYTIIAAEAIGVGGIVLGYSMKASYEKMRQEDPKHTLEYSQGADMWHNIGLGSIAFTAAIYIYNIIDAFVAPSHRPDNLTLAPTTYPQGGAGMMLAYKF